MAELGESISAPSEPERKKDHKSDESKATKTPQRSHFFSTYCVVVDLYFIFGNVKYSFVTKI